MESKTGIVVFIVILILAVVLSVLILPVFKIGEINISGTDNVTEEEVLEVLDGGEGTNWFAFNARKSEENIENTYHYVKNVSVKKHFPSTIDIEVEEYKLRAYVPYMGSYLYIDDDGRILDIQKETTKELPVVDGLKFSEFTLGEKLVTDNAGAFSTVVQLSKLFEKYNLAESIQKVDVSDITDIHLYSGKVDIVFGDFTDANEKIVRIVEILKELDTSYSGVLTITDDGGSFEFLT
jgi:cell division septal protein FtsQ